MKTAGTIGRQEAKKDAEKSSHSKGQLHTQNSSLSGSGRRGQKGGVPGAPQLRPYHFRAGESGNPGGRPKHDLAAEIARAIFEQDGLAIFDAFRKMLRKGSPYAFDVLANRGYGKLREVHQHEIHPYAEMPEVDILKRIAELEQKLGVGISRSGPELLPPADDDPKVQ